MSDTDTELTANDFGQWVKEYMRERQNTEPVGYLVPKHMSDQVLFYEAYWRSPQGQRRVMFRYTIDRLLGRRK